MSGKTSKELQEEEDQWISGEELRTEGSSDEDVSEPRASRKKQKTDVLLKRLLVSSLAFPSPPSPRTRLPNIDKTDKVVKPEQGRSTTLQTAPSALLESRKLRVKYGVGDSPPMTFSKEAEGDAPMDIQPKSLQNSLLQPRRPRMKFEVGDSPPTTFSEEAEGEAPMDFQSKSLQNSLLQPRRPRVKFEVGDSPPTTFSEEAAGNASTDFQPKSLQDSLLQPRRPRVKFEIGDSPTTNFPSDNASGGFHRESLQFEVGDSPSKNFSSEEETACNALTGFQPPKSLQESVLEPSKPRVTFELGDSPSTDFTSEKIGCDAPKSLQESLRRSLKVDLSKRHHYEKGETKSTNHLILEMNEFYFEMLDRLKFLRGNLHKKDGDEDDLSARTEWSFETTDPQVLSILAEIEKDEAEYQQNVLLLAKETQERKTILQEICASGERSQPTENQDDANEANAEPEKNGGGDGGDAYGGNQQKRATAKGEKDFIAKNKELAKEYGTMSRVCLTDEEKIKLESLLSDVDDAEVNVEENHHEAAALQGDNGDDFQDGFKLDLDEKKTLDELESKLKALSEYVEPSGAQKEIDDLSAAENQGKHWKFSLMQNRLKSIDNDLCIIRDEKDKESAVSKLEELGSDDETEYRRCLSDLAMRFDDDAEEEEEAKEDADNRENYQECLSQINLKIEETREKFERKSSSK